MSGSRLKANFIYNLAYQLLAIALPFITTPILSRAFGPTGLGVYSFTYSTANYFGVFILLGVNNYGSRVIASCRDDDNEVSQSFIDIYISQVILCVVVCLTYIIYIRVYASDYFYMRLCWLAYLISVGLDINWFFFGLEEFRITVTRNFIIKLLTFLGIVLLIHDENDLLMYVLIMAGGMLLSQVVLWPFLVRRISFRIPIQREVVRHLKGNLILFVPVLAISVYTVLDKVILGSISGATQSGFFDSSLRIASIPTLVVTALGTIMLPRITNLYSHGDSQAAKRYMSLSIWFVLLVSSFSVFGIISAISEFVILYFGTGFEPCALITSIIVMNVPFFSWANVLRNQYLIPMGRDTLFVKSVLSGAIANVVLNLVLIPYLGAIGAAVATFVAEATVCLVQTISVLSELPVAKYVVRSAPYYVIGLLSLFVSAAVGRFGSTVFVTFCLEVVSYVISYFGMVYVYWLVGTDDHLSYFLTQFRVVK